MSWGIVATAGASLLSGMMGADAAESAADTQAQSAREAAKLQKEMFDKQIELQEPFRQGGLAAQNRLMTLLGLGGPQRRAVNTSTSTSTRGGNFTPSSRMSASGPRPMLQPGPDGVYSADQAALRAQLLPQFTGGGERTVSGITWTPGGATDWDGTGTPPWDSSSAPSGYGGTDNSGAPVVDEVGLRAAIQQAQQGGQPDTDEIAQGLGDPSDPEYGSLMRDYAEPDPTLNMRDFSMADFEQDPGYAFRMEQGRQALERGAAARGGLYSGAAGRELMELGQGLGSQEYGAAFNRFQTNRANRVNDYTGRYNRFQTNRANKLNPLQSIMGAGQSSANQIGSAAQNYGAAASNLITGEGNARASGIMGGASALANGLTGGFNNYQSNRMMERLFDRLPNNASGYAPSRGFGVNDGFFGGTRGSGD